MAPPAMRVIEREVVVFRRLWRGLTFSLIVGPVLYLAAIGVGLGDLVDEGPAADDLGGLSYLEFVAPGLLAASAALVAAGESLWPVLGGMKWSRTFHATVATPVTPAQLYAGYLGWTALRTALGTVTFLTIAALLGAVPSWWGVLAIPAAVLGAAAIAAPLTAFSAAQDSDAPFPVVMRLGILPLFLFSGTFFPLDRLPSGVRPLAVASPLWHAAELCRSATSGRIVASAVVHLAVLVAFVAAGAFLGRRAFTRRLAS